MTREIPLIGGGVTLVDDEDFDDLVRHRWSRSIAGYAHRTAYSTARKAMGKIPTYHLLMHRYLLGLDVDSKVCADHINGDKLDNRRSNLRRASYQQNNRNRGPIGESRFKGVTRSRRFWQAKIEAGGEKITIGTFDTEEDAARAYDFYARQLHKEFARLNFPDDPPTLPIKHRLRSRKFDEWEVRTIRRVREEAELSYRALGRSFGTDGETIKKICDRRSYADIA